MINNHLKVFLTACAVSVGIVLVCMLLGACSTVQGHSTIQRDPGDIVRDMQREQNEQTGDRL